MSNPTLSIADADARENWALECGFKREGFEIYLQDAKGKVLGRTESYAGPETPATFKPYGVGYIQLEDKVIVESRLTTSDPDELKIGMEMEIVIIPFNTDADGNEVVTYAFAPVKK